MEKRMRRDPKGRRSPGWRSAVLIAAALWTSACHDGFVPKQAFHERQNGYLAFATAGELRPGSLLNVLNHLERAERDPRFAVPDGAVPADAWDPIFEKLFRLRDTSDFDALYLINLLYAHGGHPIAPDSLWEAADRALLDFKYWYTDPTPDREFGGAPVIDQMWYWSENHVLIFRVCEYLVGQRHPDRIFSVTGLNGAQHRERARAAILDWMEERTRFGFAEWHSDVYYQKDITPLLSLVEWAEDEELVARAEMLLDLVLLDVALHLHRGNFGATHGRSYVKDKASATTQDNFNSSKLLFDDTELGYTSTSAPDATLFSRARKYRLPAVIPLIARDDEPMVDRERMNRPIDERPRRNPDVDPPPGPPGLEYGDEANLALWWTMGIQPVWSFISLTFEVAERENLWEAQFSAFKPLRDLAWVDGDFEETLRRTRSFLVTYWRLVNQSVLKEVNTYTYRTPHYMLSTAQDYRKGLRGSQTHISQASLGEHAIVYTQHPGYLPLPEGAPIPPDWRWQQEDEPGPGYWTGNGAEPRAAQHENVVIQLYAPQYAPADFLGFPYREETHAYFPHAHFDEVVQAGSWTFGRKGDGYVALYSLLPTEWRSGQPEVFENAGLPFDLVAPGSAENVWIIECGSADEWGDFAAFRAAFESATVTATPVPNQQQDGMPDGYAVVYESPSLGVMEFDWHGPLVVDGLEIPIADYPRYDNPFVQTPFGENRYEIEYDAYRLVLDFATNERVAERQPGERRGPPDGQGQPGSHRRAVAASRNVR
jgi:hypothetical protein